MNEKTVELGFEFEFSQSVGKDRSMAVADSVVVRAPSLVDLAVHTRMVAYVDAALAKIFEMEAQSAANKRGAAQPEESSSQAKTDDDGDDSHDVMQIMSMGLGVDGYPEFVNYVRKTLTRRPALAYIQDRQPINDETWEAIAEAGGVDAVLKIVAAFADFFMTSRIASLTERGSKKPTSSATHTPDSAQSKQKPSRSKT